MANKFYSLGLHKVLNRNVDFVNDNIMVMLVSGGSFDNTDEYKSDITTEVAGTGYVTSGAALNNAAINHDAANSRVELDGDNITWSGIDLAEDITAAIVYKATGVDASSPLLMWIDTATGTPAFPFTTNGGDFTLAMNSEGISQHTPA